LHSLPCLTRNFIFRGSNDWGNCDFFTSREMQRYFHRQRVISRRLGASRQALLKTASEFRVFAELGQLMVRGAVSLSVCAVVALCVFGFLSMMGDNPAAKVRPADHPCKASHCPAGRAKNGALH